MRTDRRFQKLADLGRTIQWKQGGSFRGYALSQTADGWRVTVKAVVGGRHVVAFVYGESVEETLSSLIWEAENIRWEWSPDKFPPRKPRVKTLKKD